MKSLVLILAAVLLCMSLLGQWSQNAAFPTHIAGGDGEQVLPKTAITSDGYVYVSRFDNSSGGNYNVYLQRLDQQGVQQWDPAGILVSGNPSMSWLTDYDLSVDNEGNAIVCFQDIRSAGVNNIFIYKVNSAGTLFWAPDGITLSSDTSTDYANYSPKVYNASDNHCYVAWQRSGPANDEIRIHRLSAAGQKLWGENGITLTSGAGEYTWPQLLESSNGDILVKYFVDSGPFWAPTRHVYLARFNTEGILQWNTPITEAGGISAWNQLFAIESDGLGGAVLAWYDDRNNDMVNEVYVARVMGDGSLSMPVNGALATLDTGMQQYYPVLTVDPAQQRIYVFFKITDADQNNSGICRQLMDYSGTRFWGETGTITLALSPYVASPLYSWQTPEGVVLAYEEGAIPNSDMSILIKASCFRANGMSPFEAVLLASNDSNKYHFDYARHSSNWISLMWEEGTTAMDIYGIRVNPDGSLGMQYPAPQNLSAVFMPPNAVQLSWQAPSSSLQVVNYEIYMDNELLQVVPGTQLGFEVNGLDPGTYSFHLIAAYPDDHQSAPSNTAQVVVVSAVDCLAPGIELAMSVYPNPFAEKAEIKFFSKNGQSGSIGLFDLKGRKLEEIALPSGVSGWNSYSWQPKHRLASGIYLLKLQSGNKRIVKKITVL